MSNGSVGDTSSYPHPSSHPVTVGPVRHTNACVADAYSDGYNDGYALGIAVGYASGHAVGVTEGYADGYSDAISRRTSRLVLAQVEADLCPQHRVRKVSIWDRIFWWYQRVVHGKTPMFD